MIAHGPKSFNTETVLEPAVVSNLQDPLHQGRHQISPMSLAGMTDPTKLPWAKKPVDHTQHSATWRTPHTFKNGDIVMVSRSTASDQDWITEGHTGTIDGAGPSNTTGDASTYQPETSSGVYPAAAAWKPLKSVQYPPANMSTWGNYQAATYTADEDKDARAKFRRTATKNNPMVAQLFGAQSMGTRQGGSIS